jgi:hypothetical protein
VGSGVYFQRSKNLVASFEKWTKRIEDDDDGGMRLFLISIAG